MHIALNHSGAKGMSHIYIALLTRENLKSICSFFCLISHRFVPIKTIYMYTVRDSLDFDLSILVLLSLRF